MLLIEVKFFVTACNYKNTKKIMLHVHTCTCTHNIRKKKYASMSFYGLLMDIKLITLYIHTVEHRYKEHLIPKHKIRYNHNFVIKELQWNMDITTGSKDRFVITINSL